MTPTITFQGIPPAAFAFYAELENNNTRDWWLAHQKDYVRLVRDPLASLLVELEPAFGPGKIFRAQHDARFARDGNPYKTAQGAFVPASEGVGYYLHVDGRGLWVGGGYRQSSPPQVARFRRSVDLPDTGEELQQVVDSLLAVGFVADGERLKTVPRGYVDSHPRAELLRHRTLSLGMALGRPEWLDTQDAARHIAGLWEQLRPLVQWAGRHAAP